MRFFRGFEDRLRSIRRSLSPIIYAGSNVYCPVCDRSYRKFRAAGRGAERRPGATCPKCAARERDRFMYLYLQRCHGELARKNLRMLHIAPETSLLEPLNRLATGSRITADLVRPDVDIRLDLQSMPFKDASFDAIYCGHVLQQIPDDRAALEEMKRVLKPDGWFLLLVPKGGSNTVEYTANRRKYRTSLDAPDIIRRYGDDLKRLLQEIGFSIQMVECSNVVSQPEQDRLAINPIVVGDIYLLGIDGLSIRE